MGSSVFHGGTTTFLAILVLAFSDSYYFQITFKTWFFIIVFGLANGLFLLPVFLSEFGPLDKEIDYPYKVKEEKDQTVKSETVTPAESHNVTESDISSKIEMKAENRQISPFQSIEKEDKSYITNNSDVI